jgi:hypothetical protein
LISRNAHAPCAVKISEWENEMQNIYDLYLFGAMGAACFLMVVLGAVLLFTRGR